MKSNRLKLIGRSIFAGSMIILLALSFSARGITPGITFATNGIDLKIDSEASYNGNFWPSGTWDLKNLVPGVDKFFNFDDIKPGDHGENTISMHVGKSDSWLCIDFKNLKSLDNGQNEPEALADANGNASGELANGMEFFSWVDDGDNIFEVGERPLFGTTTQSASVVLNDKTYSIGDVSHGSSCKVNQDRYIGVYWCAGDLNVNLQIAEITCDGNALGNAAQTDSMSVDVSIRAVPSGQNTAFNCQSGNHDGCSINYWRLPSSYKDWKSYNKNTSFGSVFKNAFPGKNLNQVLNLQGDGLNALGRETVAALLSSNNSDIDYPYTKNQIISMFNNAFDHHDYDPLKKDFEGKNTTYCPFSNHKDDHEDDFDKNKYGQNDKNYHFDFGPYKKSNINVGIKNQQSFHFDFNKFKNFFAKK